jgi:hypothetical protein
VIDVSAPGICTEDENASEEVKMMSNSLAKPFIKAFAVTLLLFILVGCTQVETPAPIPVLVATVQYFTPDSKPYATLLNAEGDGKEFRLEFLLEDLPLAQRYRLDKTVCNPLLSSEEASLLYYSKETQAKGDFLLFTYIYQSSQEIPQSFDLAIDWTIGPCDDVYSFEESNVTPVPAPLVANFHFEVKVPYRRDLHQDLPPEKSGMGNGVLWK